MIPYEEWERDGQRVTLVSEDGRTVLVAIEILREMLKELGFRPVES